MHTQPCSDKRSPCAAGKRLLPPANPLASRVQPSGEPGDPCILPEGPGHTGTGGVCPLCEHHIRRVPALESHPYKAEQNTQLSDRNLKTVYGGQPHDRPAGPPEKAELASHRPEQSGISQPALTPRGHGKTHPSQQPTAARQGACAAAAPGVCILMGFLEPVPAPAFLLTALCPI